MYNDREKFFIWVCMFFLIMITIICAILLDRIAKSIADFGVRIERLENQEQFVGNKKIPFVVRYSSNIRHDL